MIDLTQSLRAGNVTLQEWYDTMRAHMKRTHVIAGSIAKGGWKQMTQADWGRLGAMTKREYAYLNRFARQLASGQIALEGKVVQRAGMYANAGHKTYQENLRIRAAEYSYREERRLIGARGESCDDCIVEAAKGWQPIGTLRPIGDSQCVSNCGCYFEFRERNPGAEMMGLKRLEAQWTT
jgi:hypothetical protein